MKEEGEGDEMEVESIQTALVLAHNLINNQGQRSGTEEIDRPGPQWLWIESTRLGTRRGGRKRKSFLIEL
jgi:hypothetical protein